MKTKNVLWALPLMVMLLGLSAKARAEFVLGTVDIQKILLTVGEGKKVRKQLETFFNDKKKVLKDDENKIKKAQEDFTKQEKVLTETAKKAKDEEIRGLIFALQNKTGEFQQELQKKEEDLKKPILDKLKDIVTDVSKKSAVNVTVEVSASPVVYAEATKDLTDDVIKAYDAKYPSK